MVKKEKIKVKDSSSKFLKYAWIAGIMLFIMSFIYSFVSSLVSFFGLSIYFSGIINSLISFALTSLFYYGFYVLGKKYDSRLIRISAIAMIVISLILLLSSIFYVIPLANNLVLEINSTIQQKAIEFNISQDSIMDQTMNEAQQEIMGLAVLEIIKPHIPVFLILILSYSLILMIIGILFGLGLMRLKIKYARVTGILELVGIILIVIGIPLLMFLIGIILILLGILCLLVASIFQIIILYQESKK